MFSSLHLFGFGAIAFSCTFFLSNNAHIHDSRRTFFFIITSHATYAIHALYLQASSLAEMGQCDVAVACAGAALALYPKSQPVRRLIVSGLDLKLCAEVR